MPKVKVAVLGLDCADPVLVFETFREHLPVLSGLMDSGVWGRLRSCDPPITCPAWMVMMTGATPGELGIYGFRNRTDYTYAGLGFANSTWVKPPKVWDVLSGHGLNSITLAVPLTFPPRPLRGCQVGCFLTPDAKSDFTWPPELKTELAAACGPYIPDVGNFRTDDKVALYQRIKEVTDNHTAYARWLLRNKPWDFFMMVEMGVDRMHHGFWKYFDSGHRNYQFDPRLNGCLREYYAHVDAGLGRILEDVPDDAWIAVVSDHGIQRMTGGIAFNEWLIREGYLVLKRRPERPVAIGQCDVDWARTTAWGDGGYYGRLFLNIKGREPQGVIQPEDVEKVKAELTAKLEALPDELGRPMGTRVLRPEKLYPVVNGIAPDLVVYFGNLQWRSMGKVGGSDPSLYRFENDSGPDDANHAQDGIFILSTKARMRQKARGPGQRAGLKLQDVARTLLHLQGVPAPAEMGGAAITDFGL